ncbi:MAG TPA: hypothetical protein VGJ79_00065 [Candidatus Dormibacteraeota bacterium]|jgi:hypothetical protein
MQEQPQLFLGLCGSRPCQNADLSDQQQGEFAEATPNLALALTVVVLAAALPCVPALVELTAQLGIPWSVPIGLNAFGLVAVVVKWASIAYGLGRYSTA